MPHCRSTEKMSDESSDSLPSPGFVSVFRNRCQQEGEAVETEGVEGSEGPVDAEGGEAVGGEDVGGEDVGGGKVGGDVGGESEGGESQGGGAEYRPLPGGYPSTAWNLEALLRSKTAPEPVMDIRSVVGGGTF